MHGVAEILANRIAKQEEYVAPCRPSRSCPGSSPALFPISAMPAGLAAFAEVLPLTHALALSATGWSTTAAADCTTSGA